MAEPVRKLSSDQVEFVRQLTATQDAMKRFCISLLAGDQGVEDVLQEANRVILEKADEFEIGTSFRAWAFSIVRFQAMAHCKRHKRENKLLFNTELVQELLERNVALDESEPDRVNALRICVSKLDDSEKTILQGRYWSEKTLEEFSTEVGRTVDSLKRALFRIRKQLRSCVENSLSKKEDHERRIV